MEGRRRKGRGRRGVGKRKEVKIRERGGYGMEKGTVRKRH